MNSEAIIDKIKKLLRMKRGGTPDEIATALRLAQELAEKHGIDLADINPEDESQRRKEEPISHTDALLSSRIPWECKYAGLLVQRFFNVSTLLRNTSWKEHRLTLIGTDWDTQIALYVYHFLVGHFRREWRSKRGRCRNRRAFLYGMYVGICSKLEERQPKKEQVPGVIPINHALVRRDQYMTKTFGKTKKSSAAPDDGADKARMQGYLAGRATNIRGGVAGGEAGAEMLPPTQQRNLLGDG